MARRHERQRDDDDMAGRAAIQLLLSDIRVLVPVLVWIPGQVASQDKGRRRRAIDYAVLANIDDNTPITSHVEKVVMISNCCGEMQWC